MAAAGTELAVIQLTGRQLLSINNDFPSEKALSTE
jgi:hypothetical protein